MVARKKPASLSSYIKDTGIQELRLIIHIITIHLHSRPNFLFIMSQELLTENFISQGQYTSTIFYLVFPELGVAQWLRHCATSRAVPGSNPGGVGHRDFSRGYRQNHVKCPIRSSKVDGGRH